MRAAPAIPAISKLILHGVRVFADRTEIPLRDLTILAGANSSGKSAAMLGALLLKQTLDSTFDPGALLLRGAHVELTSFDQLRTKGARRSVVLGLETTDGHALEVELNRGREDEVDVLANTARGSRGRSATIRAGQRWHGKLPHRQRFFLGIDRPRVQSTLVPASAQRASEALAHIVHVPGLRTPPQRRYPLTATGDTFDGRFDNYVASILLDWQRKRDVRLKHVGRDLQALGLTWKVTAQRQGDTAVSLHVGRLPVAARGGAQDLVEIADVGVGVSQALPVVVALHRARQGQVVYVEQPELHLHPRAQHAMAELIVAAAARGVRVVLETHSPMLVLGIQAAALDDRRGLDPRQVLVHWFSRGSVGQTIIESAALDRVGALAGSPIDFDDVELEAHRAYLDAVEARRA